MIESIKEICFNIVISNYTRIRSFLFTWDQYEIIALYNHLKTLKETYHHPLWNGWFVSSGNKN